MLIRSGEAPGVGWSRNMLYSGFKTLPRSVIRRQTDFAARLTRTLSLLQIGMKKESTSRRRVIRFGIRTLLVLTLIAALLFAWIAQKRSEWANEQDSMNAISEHVSYFGRDYTGPSWLYRAGFRPEFFLSLIHI